MVILILALAFIGSVLWLIGGYFWLTYRHWMWTTQRDRYDGKGGVKRRSK